MSQSSSNTSSGIGLTGILLAIFITLKLIGATVIATWPWWKVILLPFAISIGLAVAIIAVFLVITGIVALFVTAFSR